MTVSSIVFFTFSIPLKKSIKVNSRKEIDHREGILIIVKYKEYELFGEISPLAGLHEESLHCAITQVSKIEVAIKGFIPNFNVSYNSLLQNLQTYLAKYHFPPSVNFAIEMIFIQLYFRENGSLDYTQTLTVNGLIAGNDYGKQADLLVEQGFKTIKVKVSLKTTLDENITVLNNILSKIPEDTSLILDGNRFWSLDDGLYFMDRIDRSKILYVEDPFINPMDSKLFFDKTAVHCGIDESLKDTNGIEDLIINKATHAVIIKPDTFSSFYSVDQLIQLSQKNDTNVVMSNSFNSDIMINFLIELGLYYKCQYIGVDTLKWFDSLLLNPQITFSIGSVTPRRLSTSMVQWNLLTKVL